MGLRNTAYLVVQESPLIDDPREAVFELRNLEQTSSVQEPDYIMGGRAQFIRQIYRYATDDDAFTVDKTGIARRAGTWIDGGAGRWGPTLSFRTGGETSIAVRWGDERSPAGADNVTVSDASGDDVHPLVRRQVLDRWIAQTRSDSSAHTRLHIGEWTDGRFDDYDAEGPGKEPVSAGVFEHPIPIAIESMQLQSDEDQGTVEGTIEAARVSPYPFVEDILAEWAEEYFVSPGKTPVLPNA